jgi:hypothetical protein
MKAPFLFSLAFLFSVLYCDAQSSIDISDPTDVSLINLIATPEKYQGKIVRVVGYLNLEFEGNAIYIHKEDYEHALLKNAIWIDLSREEEGKNTKTFNKKYVILVGVFDMNDNGHMSLFSGTIGKISRLDIWKQN